MANLYNPTPMYRNYPNLVRPQILIISDFQAPNLVHSFPKKSAVNISANSALFFRVTVFWLTKLRAFFSAVFFFYPSYGAQSLK